MMVAQGGFDKKEEVENPSEVLLNPSDPEATFRYKAGGRHLGYVGNVVEAVGEKSSLVIVYDYQQNTYADNQFMKDYLNEKKDFSDGSFIVADGAYSGEENSRLASEHNLKLVTTNFTGRKPDEIYADFVFTDDGKYLIKCKNNRVPEDCIYDPGNELSVAYFRISDCEGCPYKERCQSRFLKTRVRKEVSWKSVGRAKQLQYMQTEEFSEYAKFRNGVEAIPSLLRRRYHVDKIPVHGKKRTRLFFGFKIAALDFQKLLDYKKALYFPKSWSIESRSLQDLQLVSWLKETDCEMAAMESTGSYWKPVYNIFEEEQIPIMVVNAQHIKGVPGRKTDVKDAEWIADLVRHGLVKASYIPNRDIIWFQITPMVSDLLIGLCAIMMVISVALYIIQNTRTLKGETV